MSFFESFSIMLTLLFAVCVGYFAHKVGRMGGEFDPKFTRLLMQIIMPIFMISKVTNADDLPAGPDIVKILLASLLFYALCFGSGWIVAKLLRPPEGDFGAYQYSLSFPNTGFLGLPVVTAIYGGAAVITLVVFNMPAALLNFSLGPIMISNGKPAGHKFTVKDVISPATVAALVSLVLMIFRVHIGGRVGEALSFVGGIMVPASLLVLGSSLANIPIKKIGGTPRLWVIVIVKLILSPIVMLFLSRLLHFSVPLTRVAVMMSAMPAGTNGTLFAMQYGGNSELAAQATLITTVLSIITIPLFVMIIP